MMGPAIVLFPWAFSQSGILLGTILCLFGFVICYRTCVLVYRSTGDDPEYYITLGRVWGKWAYYLSLIATLFIAIAAVCSLYILMTQNLYLEIVAFINWAGKDFESVETVDFGTFSQLYVALILFFFQAMIVVKKDLSIFIVLSSYGAYFIILSVLFIIAVGVYSFTNTTFEI